MDTNRLLLELYEFATVLLPFAAAFALAGLAYRRLGWRRGAGRGVATLLFALYVAVVLYGTGAGTLADLVRLGFGGSNASVNWLPFTRDLLSGDYLINVLMFVPFGLFWPLAWPRASRLWQVVTAGACFSLLIECSQLLNFRATDVDDLILNTAGALLGWLCWRFWMLLARRRPARVVHGFLWEPFLYTTVMFLGHFFLYDGMSMAGRLYGFGAPGLGMI